MDFEAVWKEVIDVNLSTRRPQPLHKDCADKYKELLISNRLGEELNRAYECVKSLPEMNPCGTTATCWAIGLISYGYRATVYAGTLPQLVEGKRVRSTTDYDRIGYIIESADHDLALKSFLGVFKVNILEGEQRRSFVRVDKDAEVDALCLLIFWHSSNSEVHSRLIDHASDLVFLTS